MNLGIKKNVKLAPFTTFRIGGPARYFVEVRNKEELHRALLWAREKRIKYFILGGGSNVLFLDKGFDGLVIKTELTAYHFLSDGLTAEAGCDLTEMIRSAAEKGLGGWEAMAGIPGTIGGAVRGNAGAFGTETKDVISSVRALNIDTEEVREFSNRQCLFAYRDSFFKQNPQWVILEATLKLKKVNPIESARLIKQTIAEREKRHLQDVAAAGSFFANPVAPPEVCALFESDKGVKCRENRVPAGWLIEEVGLKGKQIGGAKSSEQHPNYIVNVGGATAADVIMLASYIKQRVRDQFGIQLKEELTIIMD